MIEEDRVKRTEKAIKEYEEETKEKFINHWMNFVLEENVILKADNDKIKEKKYDEIKKRITWKSKKDLDIKESKYIFEDQFPLPINGNFYNAKCLLLYSNPATEKVKLEKNIKEKLIKCFQLDRKEAELVIANEDWQRWYTRELDRFFPFKGAYKNANFEKDFPNDFCFINFCAYATKSNWFDLLPVEMNQLRELPSTKFARQLVKIGIKAGKEIYVIRISEGIWKVKKSDDNDEYTFEKFVLSITK